MDKKSRIYIAGGTGLVGSAIAQNLTDKGYIDIFAGTRADGDLESPINVDNLFNWHKPEYVFLSAAKVGGIYANDTYPADFIRSNLAIQTNIIESCYKYKVKKLLFLGSSCIYPKVCPQPIKEEFLLDGKLEPTNEAYAIAKIAGIKMCQAYNKQFGTNYISCMPTNLYGPGDNYHPENSHVLPSLLKRIIEAKEISLSSVDIWGTGHPLREFLYIDDMAEACVFLMNNYDNSEIINIGSGMEISIRDLAVLIAEIVGYKGEICCLEDMPDGTYRKYLDSSKINELGWKAKISLKKGIKHTYFSYLAKLAK